MTFLLISLAFLAATLTNTFASLIDCGSAYRVNYLTVDPPSAVAIHQPVKMHGSFYVPEPILNGTVHTKVSMNFVTVFESTEDLCTYSSCPVAPGHQAFNRTTIWPSNLWGRIYTTMEFYDQFRRPFLCLQYNVFATGQATNDTGWFGFLSA